MSIAPPMSRAYGEIVDLLAAGPSPQQLAQFRPSPQAQARVRVLLDKNRSGTVTPEESAELDQYAHIEHLMRLVKARARKRLVQQ